MEDSVINEIKLELKKEEKKCNSIEDFIDLSYSFNFNKFMFVFYFIPK